MTMDTTMESGRDSNSIPKNQPKRSFDVAFLTGVSESHQDHQTSSDEEEEEDLRSADKKSVEEKSGKLQSTSGSPKSAFKKVSKVSNMTEETSGSSSSNLPVDLSLMTNVPPYYHPFSFPAIATTLSLQLLQQNNAAKGLAMSLFSHPAAAAAAAAMAAHQQSFFQQQQHQHPQQQHPSIKSGGNILQGPRGSATRPDGANNLIEDYLRAQASLYQQQQSEKDFNLFAAAAAAAAANKNGPRQQQPDSGPPAYCSYSALDHRIPRPNSTSMAPPPPPAPTSIVPQQPPPTPSQPQSGLQLPAAALAASLASAPSQNVCAKCNLSFRMTSDLVYHMRSQHRRDASTDPVRQKRQEKLRCPVCGENFRERHHLTRHMTSHEDRELEAK